MSDTRKFVVWRRHWVNMVVAVAGIIALGLALLTHSRAEQALILAKSNYLQQQAINDEAAQSAALLAAYLPFYKQLQEQGIIGQPYRLQWLETLRADVKAQAFPLLSFTLYPTNPASVTNTTYYHDTLLVKVTPMRIDFELLHEGDFHRLLSGMHAHAKGVFSAQNCAIDRREEFVDATNPAIETQARAGFKGHCELLWYSLADITLMWDAPHAP